MDTNEEILIEKSLLSLILKSNSKELFQQVINKIDKQYFSVPVTQWVYDILVLNFNTYAEIPSKTVFKDALSVLEEQTKTEYKTFLQTIYGMTVLETDFEFLLQKTINNKKYKDFLKAINKAVEDISPENIETTLDPFFIKISQITNTTMKDLSSIRRFDFSENLPEQFSRFESTDSRVRGIPTPIEELNKSIGGLKKQQLIIITAPSGEGKSIFLLNFADHAHNLGCNVLYFTIEMSYEDIESRRFSLITKIDSIKIQEKILNDKEKRQFYKEMCLRHLEKDQHSAFLEYFKKVDVSPFKTNEEDLKNFCKELENKFKFRKNHFYTVDIPDNCTIEKMKSEFKYIQKKTPIDLIVIDYLNIIEPSYRSGADWTDKNHIARNLKSWARESDIPVLTGAQLKVANNKEKLTQDDMRFSKAIFDHADHVLGFNRNDEDKLCGRIRIELVKHRHSGEKIIPIKENFSKMGIGNFTAIDDLE